jgi:hypothetical protein
MSTKPKAKATQRAAKSNRKRRDLDALVDADLALEEIPFRAEGSSSTELVVKPLTYREAARLPSSHPKEGVERSWPREEPGLDFAELCLRRFLRADLTSSTAKRRDLQKLLRYASFALGSRHRVHIEILENVALRLPVENVLRNAVLEVARAAVESLRRAPSVRAVRSSVDGNESAARAIAKQCIQRLSLVDSAFAKVDEAKLARELTSVLAAESTIEKGGRTRRGIPGLAAWLDLEAKGYSASTKRDVQLEGRTKLYRKAGRWAAASVRKN